MIMARYYYFSLFCICVCFLSAYGNVTWNFALAQIIRHRQWSWRFSGPPTPLCAPLPPFCGRSLSGQGRGMEKLEGGKAGRFAMWLPWEQ